MATYLIFTRLGPDSFREPTEFRKLADRVSEEIPQRCPEVTWKDSYVTLSRYDIVDIVEADNQAAVARATTETMIATPWKEFLQRLA